MVNVKIKFCLFFENSIFVDILLVLNQIKLIYLHKVRRSELFMRGIFEYSHKTPRF